jgi:uncharacterized protein YegP (UPF0339 family)
MNAHTIEIHKAPDGWRWTWRAGNGRVLGVSSESYQRRDGAANAVYAMEQAMITGARNLRNFHGDNGK